MKPKTTRLRLRLEERKRKSTTPPPAVANPPFVSDPPFAEPRTREPQPRNAQTLRLGTPAVAPTESPQRGQGASRAHPGQRPSFPQPSHVGERAHPAQHVITAPPPAEHSYPHEHPPPQLSSPPQYAYSQQGNPPQPSHQQPLHQHGHHEDLDNEFFSTPPPPQAPEPIEDDFTDGNFQEWERARRARRARFIRPVAWVVGVCAVIGVAASIRHYVTREGEPLAHATTQPLASSASAAPSGSVQNTPISSASVQASAMLTDAGAAATTTLDASVAMAAAPDAATTSQEDAGVAIAHSPEEAAKEKRHAQRALDSGHFKEAIAAGEQSVALDPEDAEAWLLLGASYQEAGDRTNASRCFHACLTQAKRGDRSDCSAMLH